MLSMHFILCSSSPNIIFPRKFYSPASFACCFLSVDSLMQFILSVHLNFLSYIIVCISHRSPTSFSFLCHQAFNILHYSPAFDFFFCRQLKWLYAAILSVRLNFLSCVIKLYYSPASRFFFL